MLTRSRGPGGIRARAAASAIGKIVAAEDNVATITTQAVVLPTLADARARLIEVIRQRPAPKPEAKVETAAQAARWQRQGRLAEVQRRLAVIEGNVTVATAMGVSTRTICHWRAGTRHPSVRLWHRLRALYTLLLIARGRP